MFYIKAYILIGIIFYFYLFSKNLISFNSLQDLISKVLKHVVGWPYYLFKYKDIFKDLE